MRGAILALALLPTLAPAADDFIRLPGGEFRSTLKYEDTGGKVNLPPFLLMKNPVTNAEFTAALGRAVNRPTPWPLPGLVVRAALGEFADEGLLIGPRAIPAALERAGFQFHHNTIGEALTYATAPAGVH